MFTSSNLSKTALRRIALRAALCVMATNPGTLRAQNNVWHEINTVQGVTISWRWRQELKDQFIAELKFENKNSYRVEVSFKSQFTCPNGDVKEEIAQTIRIKSGETVGGQWAGLFYYPCNPVRPIKGGYTDLKVVRANEKER